MLKVRRTRKAGHDLYTDNSQMTREEGAVACGLEGAPFRARPGCSFAAGSEGCSGSCPGACQVRTAEFHHRTACPTAALVPFSSTQFPRYILAGPSCGFSVCVCCFRLSHYAKITKISFQKQGLLGHQVNLFKQQIGFHISCKQRGPLGADAAQRARFLYFHLFVLKNKISSLGHSCINNGREPCR